MLIIYGLQDQWWYRFESVGWIIWLRWDYRRWWKACKEGNSQRGDRRWPAKPPPMRKLVWSFECFLFKRISHLRFVQTGPLYRDIGAVISLITSPRFSEAYEFGDNFLNGWKLLMEINYSKNFGRHSWIYQPLYHVGTVGFSQVLSVRPSVVWTIESSIPRCPWTTSL